MNTAQDTVEQLGRLQQRALVVGIVALLLCGVQAVINFEILIQAYLTSFLFWWGIGFGCLALLMLNHLVGGAWGYATRPILASGAATLPLLAILFLPIALRLPDLFVWARPDAVAADERLQHKALYLNETFFWARAIVYFAVWLALAQLFGRHSVASSDRERPVIINSFFSGVGIILLVFTVSFAAMDWSMSLQPHWFSTIYGALLLAGGTLSAMALTVCFAAGYRVVGSLEEEKNLQVVNDLASLMLAFVLIWSYFAFSQFLIIWSGNLPDEARWYIQRLEAGWQYPALLIVLLQFAVPFIMLLSRERKRDPTAVSRIACMILASRYLELFWYVIPAFSTSGLRVHWIDVVAPLAMGGLWMFVFLWQLKKRIGDQDAGVSPAQNVD